MPVVIKTKFITAELLGSGYAAMCYWLNTEEPNLGPFWEPFDTSSARFPTLVQAEMYGEVWGEDEHIPFVKKRRSQQAHSKTSTTPEENSTKWLAPRHVAR